MSGLISRVRSRWVRIAIRFVATAIVLTVLFLVVAWDDVVSALRSAHLHWALAMYAVILVRQLIDAFQLQYLLRRVGSEVPVGRVFLASQLASFYSIVLPGDIAASAAKWANLSVATGKRSRVLSAMVYNKLLMMSLPVLVGTMALVVDNPFDEIWVTLLAGTIFGGLVLAMLLLYHPKLGAWTEAVLIRLGRRLPARVEERVGYLATSIRSIRGLPVRHHLVMVAFVVSSFAFGVVRIWFGMKALGIGVSPFAVLWIMAFALIGRLLPITIASLGIRESLLVVALTPLGIARERAVALGLLGFSTIVLLAAIGGIYQLWLVHRSGRE